MKRRDLLKISPLALAATVGHVSLAEAQTDAHATEAVFNVRTFGATGDGKTVDTPAINKAIEAVAAAGGGTLVFPEAPTSASPFASSRMSISIFPALHHPGRRSPRPGDASGYNGGVYDAAEPNDPWTPYQDYGHNHWRNSLFYAENQQNFSVLGRD